MKTSLVVQGLFQRCTDGKSTRIYSFIFPFHSQIFNSLVNESDL